jgi:hypothetical protein
MTRPPVASSEQPQVPAGHSARAPEGSETLPTICVAENRDWCEPGVRLLIASLSRHSRDLPIQLFFPTPSDAFREWLGEHPQVSLNRYTLPGDWTGYDIKPTAIRTLIDQGHDDVAWIDSDIIVTRDIVPLLGNLPGGMVVATEEALCSNHGDAGALRTRLWNMEVGRVLPFTLNTGVIRLTCAHRDLIDAWTGLLGSDTYRAAQAQPWDQRPPHLLGDQEVFTALLSSRAFAHLPVRLLRRGKDIVQFFGSAGYTVRERLLNLRHPPAFIHAQGQKPWSAVAPGKRAAPSFLGAYRNLSPYRVAARGYADALADPSWTRPRRPAAIFFDALGGGRGPLVGLPHAIVADLVRAAKRLATRRPD